MSPCARLDPVLASVSPAPERFGPITWNSPSSTLASLAHGAIVHRPSCPWAWTVVLTPAQQGVSKAGSRGRLSDARRGSRELAPRLRGTDWPSRVLDLTLYWDFVHPQLEQLGGARSMLCTYRACVGRMQGARGAHLGRASGACKAKGQGACGAHVAQSVA